MLALARVALIRLARDRSSLFFVLLFPLLLVLLIGVSFGGEGTPTSIVVVVPDDLEASLVAELETLDLDVRPASSASSARASVADGVADAALVVDAAGPSSTADARLVTASRTGSVGLQAQVDGALARSTGEDTIRRVLDEVGVEVSDAQLAAAPEPAAAVTTTTVGGGGLAEEFAGLGQFDLGASSQLLLFVFITALVGSTGVIQSRRFGVVDRVLAGPTSPRTIILGLGLGQLAIALVQALVIVVATSLLFGVSWGDPLATTAIIVLFSAVAAAAGLLLGAALDSEERANGVSPPLALVLAALGGSMLPLELFPAALRPFANITPHAWGNTAFAEVTRRGGTLADILPNLAVLAVFASVLGGVAVVILRRRIARG